MKILITGGNGLIGRHLVKEWEEKRYIVYQVTRTPHRSNAFSLGYGDPIPDVDVIVNLAGELVVGYWTEKKKERILKSRLETTQWIIDLIQNAKQKPMRLISASAIGIYGDQGDALIDERSMLDPEKKFRYQVCMAWEEVADRARKFDVQVAKIRIGNVFSWNERFLGYVYPFWKCGVFPRLSTPETWIPWISLRDIVRMIDWTIHHEKPLDVMNGVAPNPFQWSDFEKTVRDYFSIGLTIPVDRLGMKLWMGEMAQALQDSQKIISHEAASRGFEYKDNNLESYFKANRN